MKKNGTVYGSKDAAKPIVVGKSTVYVHTNITPVTSDSEDNSIEGIYSYDEVQYDKDEYIELISTKNSELEDQLTQVQLALVEMYETNNSETKN